MKKAFENAAGEVKWSDKIAPNGVKYVEMEGFIDDWFVKQLYSLDPGGDVELYVGLQGLFQKITGYGQVKIYENGAVSPLTLPIKHPEKIKNLIQSKRESL